MTNNLSKAGIEKLLSPLTVLVAKMGANEKSISLTQKIQQRSRRIFERKRVLILGITFLIIVLTVFAVILIRARVKSEALDFKPRVYQSTQIGKTIEFPIRYQGKATKDTLKMTFTSVERTNKILIKAQPATARKGKTFLIINLELDNPTQNKLNLAPVELIRLTDSSGKKFAADVHSDKVTVEPISVKKTRVGFVIDEVASGFKLQVGEVGGEKKIFDLII